MSHCITSFYAQERPDPCSKTKPRRQSSAPYGQVAQVLAASLPQTPCITCESISCGHGRVTLRIKLRSWRAESRAMELIFPDSGTEP